MEGQRVDDINTEEEAEQPPQDVVDIDINITEFEGEVNLEQLPQEIIQHVLSYLERRSAARVGMLSKTLYDAWCLQPILKLKFHDNNNRTTVQADVPSPISVEQVREDFSNYVNKSFERYRSQTRCPQQLDLTVRCGPGPDPSCFLEELVSKFEEAGVGAIRVTFDNHGRNLKPNLFGVLGCKGLAEFNARGCKLK